MRKRRAKRIILGVLVVAVPATVALIFVHSHFVGERGREFGELYDLHEIICEYVRTHDGVMPDSFDDLVSSGLARKAESGTTAYVCLPPHRYSRNPPTIKDLRKYRIAYGTKPQDVRITRDGAFDPEGNPFYYILPAGRTWLRVNLNVYRAISRRIAHTVLSATDRPRTQGTRRARGRSTE